jgi:ubiquinone/menaquinone biosynthesis C-methylase UbiE
MERDLIELQVARHYAQSDLERTVLDALVASGKELDRLTASDLAPVDEFHIGGREATSALAEQMAIAPGSHLLDIGCGIGGASRFRAEAYGCRVTGVDLTEDYVRTAEALARRIGLAGRARDRQASALALPFAPGTFDGAYMMHVGMNVEDKPALFAEARRVLKPGGVFAIYDVMQTGEGELRFPLPFAASPETSFVASPAEYRRALAAAGFEIGKERDRRAFAIDFFQRVQARVAEAGGAAPLGTHLLMGTNAPQKLANVTSGLDQGLIAPIELICRVR